MERGLCQDDAEHGAIDDCISTQKTQRAESMGHRASAWSIGKTEGGMQKAKRIEVRIQKSEDGGARRSLCEEGSGLDS